MPIIGACALSCSVIDFTADQSLPLIGAALKVSVAGVITVGVIQRHIEHYLCTGTIRNRMECR
jgi:hypothetical protein